MAIVVLVAPFFTASSGRRNANYYLSSRGTTIGKELVATTNSQYLVRIGPGLQNKLTQFLSSESHLDSVKSGDAPSPIGDGKAHMCVYLKNSRGEWLAIRLRRSQDPDKFEVLGFWSPASEN